MQVALPKKNDSWMGIAILVGLMILLFCGILVLAVPKIFPNKEGQNEGLVEGGNGKAKGQKGGKPVAGGAFPRRALVFSLHNYLYANPVGTLAAHDQTAVARLPEILPKGKLNLPKDQVLWVSDMNTAARQPVVKKVFEKTLESYLSESRPQDRVLVTFVGHATAIGEKGYLIPLEGDPTQESTLIPLEWVYARLKECKARQKVLILDVCRFNAATGQERPGAEPMSKELAAAIAAVPEGVEVICSCKEGERSWESEVDPAGLFLGSLSRVLDQGLKGQIQKPADPIPVERIVTETRTALGQKSQELGQTQTLSKYGSEAQGEVEESADIAAVPKVQGAEPPPEILVERTKRLLDGLHLPPVKVTSSDDHFDPKMVATLCDPESKAMADFAKLGPPPAENKAFQFMEKVRAHLWGISSRVPPEDLKKEVDRLKKKEVREDLKLLKAGFRAAEDAVLKKTVEANQRSVATILGLLEEDLTDLEKLNDERDELPPLWRAQFDFVQAKLEAEAAYLWEYQSLLGQMRKEAPARDPKIHGGWVLASIANPQGDSKGKKLAKSSKKIYEDMIKKYPGTPWAILAKRELGTALGLEWQAVP